MLKIIREILQQYIDKIDSGNSNISEKELMKLIDIFREINKKELSALEACDYIGVCKSDVIDDKDGYDGIVFNRWYADMVIQGIPIEWEDML